MLEIQYYVHRIVDGKPKQQKSVPSDDVRRKVYATSEAGKQILRKDYERISHMLGITKQILLRERYTVFPAF